MKIELKHANYFEDFSGAPAIVVVDGFSFAFDRVGHTICNCLNGSGRSPSARVLALARLRYAQFLATLPEGWLTENEACYLVDIETV